MHGMKTPFIGIESPTQRTVPPNSVSHSIAFDLTSVARNVTVQMLLQVIINLTCMGEVQAWHTSVAWLEGLAAETCERASCDAVLWCAGSYSYVGLQASSKTYDDLAKPVQRRVMFAGEHTCKVSHALLLGILFCSFVRVG